MESIALLKRFCDEIGCDAILGEPMSRHTTFQVGGPADIFITPENQRQVSQLITYLCGQGIRYHVLGKGSNVLVGDSGIRGAVIHIGRKLSGAVRDGNTISCGAGMPLAELCRFALQEGLSGLEFAYGIPGSAGGAAYMNAGAYGGEMRDVLLSCRHVDSRGNPGELSGEDLRLSYRKSAYSDSSCCITGVTVGLTPAPKDVIRERMTELMCRREEKQPLEYPSAGSTFKRPANGYAAEMIERCGLKGCSVGGAMVSTKHSGFVVNAGGATCDDVLRLIDVVKKQVLHQTGTELECEVKLLD